MEQKIIEQCFREKKPLPRKIREAPELWLGMELFYGAFLDLHTCRMSGFDIGPIPWTAMDRWAERHEVDDDLADEMFRVLRQVDAAYMNRVREKNKT